MRLFDHEWETEDSYFLVHRAEVGPRPEVIAFRKWLIAELRAASMKVPAHEGDEVEEEVAAAAG
jgi:hypothetical protein